MDKELTTIEKRIAKDKELLLRNLLATGDPVIACRKSGIGRSSYYRYRKFDSAFAAKADEARVNGMLQLKDITEKIQQTIEDRDPNKGEIYAKFVEWYALPSYERERAGIADQKEFAELHHIGVDTLTRWKKRPDFNSHLSQQWRDWCIEKTSLVLASILKSSVQGNAGSQRIWMKHCGGIEEPKKDVSKAAPGMSVDDIRLLLDGFPEDIRIKHYISLSHILDDIAELGDEKMSIVEGNLRRNRPDFI